MTYNIRRFLLAFNSWIFWLKIPNDEIATRHWTGNMLGEEYNDKWPKHHNWSVHDGKKVAENFWQIINDGLYEMREEYEW
jgi:hypothetical protein